MNEVKTNRRAAHNIDPIYTERWSSRAFSDKEIPMEILQRLFEAARWAPSAANKQPWKFIYAQSQEDRERFLTFINDGNTIWCDKAPVLVAVVSRKTWSDNTEDINPTYAFDTGAAWGYLALEAARQGLVAHAMGGFNRDKAKEVLNIPENYDIHAIVAVGYRGDKEDLTDGLQEREVLSDREVIETFTSEGTFAK